MGNTNNTINIDVTKCIGCRKGVSMFTIKEGVYIHHDLFASAEAGASYKCNNTATIGNYLVKNGERGTFLPNDNAEEFFDKQESWWEDIITLAYNTFKEQKFVSDFFNGGNDGSKVLNLPNVELENKLLANAKEKGIEITEDKYPYLILWESKN